MLSTAACVIWGFQKGHPIRFLRLLWLFLFSPGTDVMHSPQHAVLCIKQTHQGDVTACSECLSSYCLHTREDCRTNTGRYVNKSRLYIPLDLLRSYNLWWPVFLRKNLHSCKAGVNKAQNGFKCWKKCEMCTVILQKSQWHRRVKQQKYPTVSNKQMSLTKSDSQKNGKGNVIMNLLHNFILDYH